MLGLCRALDDDCSSSAGIVEEGIGRHTLRVWVAEWVDDDLGT